MSLHFLSQNKKLLLIMVALAVLFVISGIVSPVVINNIEKNWGGELDKKVSFITNAVRKDFRGKEDVLIQQNTLLSKNLVDATDLIDLVNRANAQKYNLDSYGIVLEIYDADFNLVFWNNQPVFAESGPELNSLAGKGTVFRRSALQWSLCYVNRLEVFKSDFFLALSLPVEKEYKLSNQYYKELSLTDSLSAAFNTEFNIYFNPDINAERDGRRHYFNITNTAGTNIALVSFEKPYLDVELNWWRDFFSGIQSLLIILSVAVLGFLIKSLAKRSSKKVFRFLIYFVYFGILRVIMFITGVPTDYLKIPVTESAYFSSAFGFGIVRSPLEFSITLLFVLLLLITGYKYTLEYLTGGAGKDKGKTIYFYISAIVSLVFYLLTLRGLGASIRSIIFDSTLRYFKSPSLIPELPGIIMLANALVLGLIVILFSMILLFVTYSFSPFKSKKSGLTSYVTMFLVFQVAAFLYDLSQKQPQGTPFIRFIYICLTFLIAYAVIFKMHRSAVIHLYYALAASVISVSLLIYYNSELEREALKITAQEITRVNESQYEFIVFQTVAHSVANDFTTYTQGNIPKDPALAFRIWSNSLLQKETIPSYVQISDLNGMPVSRFDVGLKESDYADNASSNRYADNITVNRRNSPFGGREVIAGTSPIKINGVTSGYLEIGAAFEEGIFNLQYFPKYLMGTRSGINSAVDYDKLEIFSFDNGNLIRSYGGVNLSSVEISKIISAQTGLNEAWLRIKLNKEDYLFYAGHPNGNENVIAVGIEEKNFSWSLYDFFKIFFIHMLFILTAILVYGLISFRKTKSTFTTFRARLIFAFLVVSLIPLFFLAGYFRNLTEGKNRELLTNELGKDAGLIVKYAETYGGNSDVDLKPLLEKAGNDLNLKFELFRGQKLYFSNYGNLVDAALEPAIINPDVYFEFESGGLNSILEKERINNFEYNSYYLKSNISGTNYIVKISDVYNNIDFPLTDLDTDIFLFGTYSLASILIILLSAFFANQISAPIRKLTLATRSVAGGDLNVELNYNTRGEAEELITGFNRMVKELKKSQTELGQMERELAWKEMAKQVAHEIKNPLTPMKLAVQQLSAAYKDQSPKFNMIFEKVTATLISQIEILKNIASEFSNFARMPGLKIEKISLASVITETADLFSDERAVITTSGVDKESFVNADRDHLKRTFINLIRNSIQAGATKISISAAINDSKHEIRFSDNGNGIPQEIIHRVFEDNFTTKTHGMGIGLSMAKRFIENIEGVISVEESNEKGTVILITIPAVV